MYILVAESPPYGPVLHEVDVPLCLYHYIQNKVLYGLRIVYSTRPQTPFHRRSHVRTYIVKCSLSAHPLKISLAVDMYVKLMQDITYGASRFQFPRYQHTGQVMALCGAYIMRRTPIFCTMAFDC